MKRFIYLIVGIVIPVIASAYDSKIDGIYYLFNETSKTATVTFKESYQPSIYDRATIYKSDYTGNVIVPSEVAYNEIVYNVTAIGDNAFNGCEGLASVSIPNSVKTIGVGAFRGCINMTTVNIPEGVTHISEYTFLGCGLTSISIPSSVTEIYNQAFSGCSRLTSLSLPNSVTFLDFYAFSGCSGLTSLSILSNDIKIYDFAFMGCGGLKEVYCYANKVPNKGAFANYDYSYPSFENTSLHVHDVLIDDYKETWPPFNIYIGLDNIDFKLTYYVDNEKYKSYDYKYGEQIIPEEEPTKGDSIFSGWSDIPETMPSKDIDIYGTFRKGVYKLIYKIDGEDYRSYAVKCYENIIPEQEPKKKGMTFSGWSEIPETMPERDVEVTGSFEWTKVVKDNIIYLVTDTINNFCSVLGCEKDGGEVKIVAEVGIDCTYTATIIADKAFRGCSNITKIEIPATVSTIGERAFANIDNLEDVTCGAEVVPTTNRTAFEDSYVEDYVALHVPAGAVEKYKASLPWSGFKNIIAIGGTEPSEKCSVPTIDYRDGKLVVNCDTEGSECVTAITSDDFGEHQSNEIDITATYNISAYAKAEGYANSDEVTATLCWIEVEGSETKINENIESKAALIQSKGGTIWVTGRVLGSTIEVYNTAGQLDGSEIAVDGTTTISTNLKAGDIALVKIGKKTVKIMMR